MPRQALRTHELGRNQGLVFETKTLQLHFFTALRTDHYCHWKGTSSNVHRGQEWHQSHDRCGQSRRFGLFHLKKKVLFAVFLALLFQEGGRVFAHKFKLGYYGKYISLDNIFYINSTQNICRCFYWWMPRTVSRWSTSSSSTSARHTECPRLWECSTISIRFRLVFIVSSWNTINAVGKLLCIKRWNSVQTLCIVQYSAAALNMLEYG